jgi:hypothetical protein
LANLGAAVRSAPILSCNQGRSFSQAGSAAAALQSEHLHVISQVKSI